MGLMIGAVTRKGTAVYARNLFSKKPIDDRNVPHSQKGEKTDEATKKDSPQAIFREKFINFSGVT